LNNSIFFDDFLVGPTLFRRLKCSSAGQEVKDKNDDGKDQEDMNPTAQGVAADQSYDPENEEDNGDCPKHLSFS
jgi:hypothetical protein